MCVAMYSWVCRSIVDRFVRLSGKAYWGWCLGVCISLVGWGGFVQVHWVLPGWVIVVVVVVGGLV